MILTKHFQISNSNACGEKFLLVDIAQRVFKLKSFKLSCVVTPRTLGLIVETLSNNDCDGYENVTHTK